MKINKVLLSGIFLCVVFGTSSAQQIVPTSAAASRNHLMPIPASIQFRVGRLNVGKSFSAAIKGSPDQRLQSGIERMLRRMEGRIGLELPRKLADADGAALIVQSQNAGELIPSVDEDESYSLEVNAKQAVLTSNGVVGALRGMETLLQLLESDHEGYFIPAVTVRDQPRFRWRGLMIDVSRHFQPIEVIKRNLDGMAAVKLNVLHWHLSDNQGFRVESRKYPKLQRLGSDGQYYTHEQIRDIIAYARERGIRVVPEFDMPGHATSWLVGYPELGSAAQSYQLERQPGIMDPVLDPTREEVYKFLDVLLGEMADLFPDAYIHIGGDENEGKHWDQNPEIQAFMKKKGIKDNHGLQSYFNLRVSQILQKHGKKMIGWDEILNSDLPKNIVIQSWRGPDSLAAAAKKGFDGILSNGYYINLMYPAADHYRVDPIPANSDLTPEQAAHILGGEATMWTEYVSPETIDSRIWPRTAAIAERFWSPRAVTDVDDMYRRLDAVSAQMEELGLTHLRNKEVLLRRLAGRGDISPLETLVSVIEPVKQYNRGKMHPTTMLSPLTSLVDAAHADATAARPLAGMVNCLLSDAPRFDACRDKIRLTFTEWREASPALEALLSQANMQKAKPLAGDLSELGTAGLEALSFLSLGVAPPEDWRAAKMIVIDQAAKPKDAMEFAVIPSIKMLVNAAAEIPQLKSTPAAEWKTRVQTLSAAETARSIRPGQ